MDPEFEKGRLREYDGLRHLGAFLPFVFVAGSCMVFGDVIVIIDKNEDGCRRTPYGPIYSVH